MNHPQFAKMLQPGKSFLNSVVPDEKSCRPVLKHHVQDVHILDQEVIEGHWRPGAIVEDALDIWLPTSIETVLELTSKYLVPLFIFFDFQMKPQVLIP